jgi:O-succinylbenzoate synthase
VIAKPKRTLTLAQWKRFSLPLLYEPQGTSLARAGLLLQVRDADGNFAWGEASPWAGLHAENVNDLESILVALTESNRAITLEDWALLPPSLAFAFEMASDVLAMKEQRANSSWPEISKADRTIAINGLVQCEARHIASQGASLVAQGFDTLKVKVGRGSVDDEIAALRALRQAIGKKISVRLDANRGFELEAAIDFCKKAVPLGIEYIEEPLRDPSGLLDLHRATDVALALDESLQHGEQDVLHHAGIAAYVLKPPVLGLGRTRALAASAKSQGIKVVLTSAYESGYMHSYLALLHAELAGESVSGLSTFAALERDLISPPFRPFRGHVHIQSCVELLRQFTG